MIALHIPYKQHRRAKAARAGLTGQEKATMGKHYHATPELFHGVPSWETFCAVFRSTLEECREKYPEMYEWSDTDLPAVTERMLRSYWDDKGISYYGRAIQLTMRRLGMRVGRESVRMIVDTEKERRTKVSS